CLFPRGIRRPGGQRSADGCSAVSSPWRWSQVTRCSGSPPGTRRLIRPAPTRGTTSRPIGSSELATNVPQLRDIVDLTSSTSREASPCSLLGLDPIRNRPAHRGGQRRVLALHGVPEDLVQGKVVDPVVLAPVHRLRALGAIGQRGVAGLEV